MNEFSYLDKIKAYWKIIRVIDDVVIGLGLIVALALVGSIQQNLSYTVYIMMFFGGFFISAHVMVINDIVDIEIDKINEPNRVLPQGIISKTHALIYSLVLAIIGLFCFYYIDVRNFMVLDYSWLFILAHIILGDIYNLFLKKLGFLGNLTVAYTSFAIFFFVDLYFNGHLTLVPTVVGLMAFSANLGREIFKGIIDIEGDEMYNVQTIAVVFGSTVAKYLASACLVLCIGLGLYVFTAVGVIGKTGIVLFTVLYLYILFMARQAEQPEVARTIKHYVLSGPLLLTPFFIIDQLVVI